MVSGKEKKTSDLEQGDLETTITNNNNKGQIHNIDCYRLPKVYERFSVEVF